MASIPAPRSSPVYFKADDPFVPLPKNGHLSEVDPIYAWPQEGREVLTSTRLVPVRDGAEIEIRVYQRPNVNPEAALMFRMHGGGWATGGHGMEEAENFCLAAKHEVVLVSVAYRLAPEWPFPTGARDCFDVLKWCKDNAPSLGIDPERIITIGGSAGGNLSAVMAIMARDQNLTGIVGQILNFPVICHPKHFASLASKYELASYIQNADDSILSAIHMEFFWDCYDPDAGREAYHSPLVLEDLAGLPPACEFVQLGPPRRRRLSDVDTVIQVGGLDVLRDEGIAYGEALMAAGTGAEVYAYRGLPHVFPIFFDVPQRDEYFRRQDEFIGRVVRESSRQ
ncbi:hypothetical protein BR93DRAFT_198320 [Coniochaeta sp. PMI_546]|nr:hypothetical protein BR93DRAFT_198320 [Coniochaeta sp. PMI_546]